MNHRWIIAGALILGLVPIAPSVAHHGWGWATGEEFELAGTVMSVRHGNPHGTMLLATRTGGPRRSPAAAAVHSSMSP
jgi:hypothetical protein